MTRSATSVLITGGAGFLGSHLVAELLRRGYFVVVYDNFSKGQRKFLPADDQNLEIVNADILNTGKVTSTLIDFRCNAVIHLAAIHYIPECNANPQLTIRTNVEGTESVLRPCVSAGVEKFIYASTGAVYGIKDEPNREGDQPDPVDIYGMTKVFGEALVRNVAGVESLQCITARLFNIYGPNETNPHLIPEIVDQLLHGATQLQLGNLTPKRDFIHVTDVARALVALLNYSGNGYEVFNVGTGTEFSAKEVVETCESILQTRLEIVSDSSRHRKTDRPHLLADIDRIQSRLGWRPRINLEQGLRQLLNPLLAETAVA